MRSVVIFRGKTGRFSKMGLLSTTISGGFIIGRT
jgi:hypothetical protein